MSIAADLRQTWRNARRAPGLTLAVVLTLAVGIGANGAVWSVLRAVLLEPLPYPQPERLLKVTSKFPTLGFETLLGLAARVPRVPRVEPIVHRPRRLSRRSTSASPGTDQPVRVRGAVVSASLFSGARGCAPQLGRVFTEAEDVDGGPPVAVISHRLWVESFGASPAVVGGPITIDGAARTLLGVMPPRFDLEEGGIQVWLPLGLVAQRSRPAAAVTSSI